jgi:two-component system chemotaxis response regulator CheB
MAGERIVLVGASAGGVKALQKLAAQLGPDFPAPVLAVQHIGSHPSILPSLLSRSGQLHARHAADGEIVRAGHIYVAPPDCHMLLEGERIRITRGPKENHARPAIDPLFRSAALSRGAEAIGVLLTGMLDDGTAGLQAIARRGGTVVVQDPADAEAPSMPASALRYTQPDHVVPLIALGALLRRLVAEPAGATPPADTRLVHENEIMFGKGRSMDHLPALGAPSTFVCPDCSGSLWRIEGADPPRFRCHTGHGYTLLSLVHAQGETADGAVWSALRALQEKEMLLRVLAEEAESGVAEKLERKAEEVAGHAKTLRALIEGLTPSGEPMQ